MGSAIQRRRWGGGLSKFASTRLARILKGDIVALHITRRQLVGAVPGTALGLAGLQQAAFAAPGALQNAENQELRLVSWGLPAYIRPSNEGGPLRMMTENTFMPPFYEDESGALVPGICTEWSVSDDGLTYTLKMNPDAKFSDGTPVTASDLKFSWEYASYPDTKSGTAQYLTGPIVGSADVFAGTATEISGLVATDDATLQITLVRPFSPFSKTFSTFFAGVVKRDNALSGDTWDENPINCGPYKLESWDKAAGELNWVPNEHWWGPAPTITKINYRYIQDVNTQSIMYDNDEVDVIHPSDILSAQLNNSSHAQEMYLIPYGGTVFFAFDTTRAPMDDVNVRRALLKATDMGTIIQAVFQGGAVPAFGMTSFNLSSFNDPASYFDADGAKAALAASTYGTADKLPPITIRVGTNTTEYVRVAEALQQMWKDILGIDITISTFAQGELADDGTSQVFRISAGTLYSDPGVLVTNVGLSTNATMITYTKAKNAELDDLLNQGNATPVENEDERIQIFRQAEDMIMDQAYFIPIIWVRYYFATKPWVTGLKSNSSLSLYTLPEITVTEH
jgi:ABC-type transport system substrate-binding protein